MRYTFYLTDTQWVTLWLTTNTSWQVSGEPTDSAMELEYHNRIIIFESLYPKLKYREADATNGYYGIVSYNDEADINWFLLQL